MISDFDYLLKQFSLFDLNEIEAILKDFELKNKMVFYFVCRLLIEVNKNEIDSKELLGYIINDLRGREIDIVSRGSFYFINDPKINPRFINDPNSNSQEGKFNPDGWFSASITKTRSKGYSPKFDRRWLDFIDGYKEARKPYKYKLIQTKREVIRQAILHSQKNETGKQILYKAVEYALEEDTELIKKVIADRSISATEREAIIKSRIGQGRFREDLIVYWDGKCAVTRLPITRLLKASHIKPWRDSDNYERLDLFNGLLLSPNLDSLLDRFLISFDIEGKILLSQSIDSKSLALLGIDSEMRLPRVNEKHQKYLNYHRQKFNS